jgi:hypothetical protein
MKTAMKPLRIDAYIRKSLARLVDDPNLRRVTTFLSPKVTVKVTRQSRKRANAKQQTFLLSVGSPNFLERRELKKIKAFPQPQYEAFTNS